MVGEFATFAVGHLLWLWPDLAAAALLQTLQPAKYPTENLLAFGCVVARLSGLDPVEVADVTMVVRPGLAADDLV